MKKNKNYIKFWLNFKAISLIVYSFLSLFYLSSCAKKIEDPLIIPENFYDLPSENEDEKPKKEANQKDIDRIKDLLLKSEE